MSTTPNTVTLTKGDKTYHILGTAHVSQKSVEEVEQLIQEVAPDTVCVELCATRYQALTDKNRWQKLNVFEVIKQGKTLFLLANLALTSFQRKMGDQLGVKPGAELVAAVDAAERSGAMLVLADRDVQVTLKRTWARIPWWKKMMVLSGVFESLWAKVELKEEDLEQMKDKDHLSHMMEEFARELPEVKEPLIDERDRYLMSKIEQAEGETIVAVVGAGHVQGITEHFGSKVDLPALESLPPRNAWAGALKWLIPILVLAAFYVGYSKHSGETLEEMLYAWVLPNSFMAALLSAIAGAKLLSILTAFFASPLTSLNPTLGAGMVVGLMEAWLRKPTVEDMEALPADIKSLKGFYRNPFTRVLMVTVFSTLGSALGAIVGLGWLVAIWSQ